MQWLVSVQAMWAMKIWLLMLLSWGASACSSDTQQTIMSPPLTLTSTLSATALLIPAAASCSYFSIGCDESQISQTSKWGEDWRGGMCWSDNLCFKNAFNEGAGLFPQQITGMRYTATPSASVDNIDEELNQKCHLLIDEKLSSKSTLYMAVHHGKVSKNSWFSISSSCCCTA